MKLRVLKKVILPPLAGFLLGFFIALNIEPLSRGIAVSLLVWGILLAFIFEYKRLKSE